MLIFAIAFINGNLMTSLFFVVAVTYNAVKQAINKSIKILEGKTVTDCENLKLDQLIETFEMIEEAVKLFFG